ncbi:hypothetical protein BOX15_Mlig027111g1, partial [Macrostomum lignano]
LICCIYAYLLHLNVAIMPPNSRCIGDRKSFKRIVWQYFWRTHQYCRLAVLLPLICAFVLGLTFGIWICQLDSRAASNGNILPTIYVVTATYKRPEQRAELTRLCNTLARVPAIHWLVVEDADSPSSLVADTIGNCGVLSYTHLYVATPEDEKLKSTEPYWWRPEGVRQRNLAFEWLRNDPSRTGVMYIADDDNTYDVRLFDEIRATRRVSVWPVAFAGGLLYEGIRCAHGRVLGWIVAFKPHRQFPLDMAGFAINLQLLHERPAAKLAYKVERGFQESLLLTSLGVRQSDLEARANDCSRILVWHTRTAPPKLNNVALLAERGLTLPPVIGHV